jgi:hypothetical protein
MPIWKVSHFFEFGTAGWSEIYHSTAATAEQAADLSPASVLTFLDRRAPGVLFKAIRVVDVHNPRVGTLRPINVYRDELDIAPGADDPYVKPDVAGTSFYCRLSAAAGPSRPLFLRGLQDGIVLRKRDGTPRLTWAAVWLREMETIMKNAPAYEILSIRPSSFPQARNYKVLAVEKVQAGVCKLTLSNADGGQLVTDQNKVFNGNQDWKVIVSGGSADAHDFPGLRGVFTVLGVDGPSIKISYDLPFQLAGPQAPKKLKVRNLYYVSNPITKATGIDFRTRDTGRPTNLRRGRSRKVLSRH